MEDKQEYKTITLDSIPSSVVIDKPMIEPFNPYVCVVCDRRRKLKDGLCRPCEKRGWKKK